MPRFLVGSTLREVRNARLNCNNAANETLKGNTKNGTYVKKIRKDRQTFPYASAQWQKKAIKTYVKSQGHKISPVKALSTSAATSDGNPFLNYDEDIMGFMIAKKDIITEEKFKQLNKEEQKGWKKEGKEGYTKNVTVKRRSNLMLSTLQAIGHTRITDEFSSRETNETSILYSKQVYAADMSSSFILDIENSGVFTVSDNESAYRDYTDYGLKEFGLQVDGDKILLDKEEKLRRIKDTIKGIQHLSTRTTMTNNLEDLTAKFIIFGEYEIGNSLFNNIFEDNRLKLEYLKEAIAENEEYRIKNSKIYIGVRSEYFKQEVEEGKFKYLREIIEEEFGSDKRFFISDVGTVIEKYNKSLVL